MNLFDKRLIFIMGKGGVGKSVISSAMALNALKRDKRVLLVQINTQDKSSIYLDTEPIEDEIVERMPNLFCVNINPQAAMKEYVLLQVKLELIYRLVFENRAVKYFLRAVPALNDLVVLGKIYYHVQQKGKKGKPLYDVVIVDAPSTGHSLHLLQLPLIMTEAVQSGPVFKEATGMLNMLRDPSVTSINLVTLSEEMPVTESIEMYEKVRDDLQMPMDNVIVNSVLDTVFDENDEQLLNALYEAMPNDNGEDDITKTVRSALMEVSWRKLNERFYNRILKFVDLPVLKVPFLFLDEFNLKATETVARALEDEMAAIHGS